MFVINFLMVYNAVLSVSVCLFVCLYFQALLSEPWLAIPEKSLCCHFLSVTMLSKWSRNPWHMHMNTVQDLCVCVSLTLIQIYKKTHTSGHAGSSGPQKLSSPRGWSCMRYLVPRLFWSVPYHRLGSKWTPGYGSRVKLSWTMKDNVFNIGYFSIASQISVD